MIDAKEGGLMLQAISIIATIVLAFVGYVVTYLNNVRLENRKSQLKFISDQLQYLYGPLSSLSLASTTAWVSFRSRCRPGQPFFGGDVKPSEDELVQWRLWMTEVFMPLNLKMEAAIVNNAHLIEGKMPDSFTFFLAHTEVYRVVQKKWEKNNFSEHTSYVDYPESFNRDILTAYETLKSRQMILMGKQ